MPYARFGSFSRGILLATALAALPSMPARSAEVSFPTDETVSRFVLPISPFVFDLIVQSTRSLAEITYDRRGYDPITNTLFVNGLHIRRDQVDVSIGRARLDLGSVLLEDFAIDTNSLDLPPPVVEALRRIGRNKLEGDMLIGVKANAARSSYEVTMRYDLDDIGAIAGQAVIDDFHVMIPVGELAYGDVSGAEAVTGSLVSATIGYQDKGLMALALQIAAEQQGSDPQQVKDFIVGLPSNVAQQIIASISGGASPALAEKIMAWAGVVQGFIKDEDAIRVTLAPAEPVPLQRLVAAETLDEVLILALNPSVTRGFAIPAPPAALPGTVAEASTLISGSGAPQNREEGARKLFALAAPGNIEAVRAIGASFGAAPAPALEASDAANLYVYLLVARAVGENVSDGTLAALTAKLSPEAVLAADQEAISYFARNGGAPPPRNLGEMDANDVRALAYDYYEGRGVPRNFTRALTLALIASAAGDPFAGDLRDDLSAAAARKEIVLDLAAARSDAELGWKAYQAAHPGAQ